VTDESSGEASALAPLTERDRGARGVYLACRAVGLVSLLAFSSLHVQLSGLFGEQGIVPLAPRLSRVSFVDAPSLLLFAGGGDGSLHAVALVGELASLAVALGVVPGLGALVAWLTYLSFVSVGWPFLPLQWDTLLLEALVLVAAVSPWDRWRVRPTALPEPAPLSRAVLVFLVCRLHFASGMVKVLSGDPHWADLSALDFHFETQPLPGPLSPFAHHLPSGVHALMVAATYAIEIALPWAALARRGRLLVAGGFVVLQLAIVLTGNYGFFNLLSIALVPALLDDAQLERLSRWLVHEPAARPFSTRFGERPRVVVLAPLALFAAPDPPGPRGGELPMAFDPAVAAIDRLHLTSEYGPFGVMTTERREIVIELSENGVDWVEQSWAWKPDRIDGALPFLPGHMPRLDWMLWFAALGEPEDSVWVLAVERALLERRAPVLDLVGPSPLAGPPRSVRAVRYRYRFASSGASDVWVREGREPFGPTLTRRE